MAPRRTCAASSQISIRRSGLESVLATDSLFRLLRFRLHFLVLRHPRCDNSGNRHTTHSAVPYHTSFPCRQEWTSLTSVGCSSSFCAGRQTVLFPRRIRGMQSFYTPLQCHPIDSHHVVSSLAKYRAGLPTDRSAEQKKHANVRFSFCFRAKRKQNPCVSSTPCSLVPTLRNTFVSGASCTSDISRLLDAPDRR